MGVEEPVAQKTGCNKNLPRSYISCTLGRLMQKSMYKRFFQIALAALAFPFVLSATPLCFDCDGAFPQSHDKKITTKYNPHACCNKEAKIKTFKADHLCISCIEVPQVTQLADTKISVHTVHAHCGTSLIHLAHPTPTFNNHIFGQQNINKYPPPVFLSLKKILL